MRIVDLHYVELLDDLLVNLDLPCLEGGNDLLAEVDGDQIIELIEALDLFVSLND